MSDAKDVEQENREAAKVCIKDFSQLASLFNERSKFLKAMASAGRTITEPLSFKEDGLQKEKE